jgi:hypothetical protein
MYASSAASLIPSPSVGTVKSSQTSILWPGGRKREFGSIFVSVPAVVVVFPEAAAVIEGLSPVCSSGSMETEETSSLPERSN